MLCVDKLTSSQLWEDRMKWFLIVLALGLTACGDDDGSVTVDSGDHDSGADDAGNTDAGSDAGPISCGPLVARTPDCGACMQANCCFELDACGDETICSNLVACLRTCDDVDASTDCAADCSATHGFSSSYNLLVICVAEDCDTECPFNSP